MSESRDTLAQITALEEQVAALTERLQRVETDMYTDKKLESPAAADPDPVCATCGHHALSHPALNSCRCLWCDCKEFASALPAAPEPLDPVLAPMAECYRATTNAKVRQRLQQAFLDHCEDDTFNVTRAHNVLLAYGKPVTR